MQRDRITCLLGEQRGTKYQTAREVSSALLTQGARRNRYSPNSVFLPPMPTTTRSEITSPSGEDVDGSLSELSQKNTSYVIRIATCLARALAGGRICGADGLLPAKRARSQYVGREKAVVPATSQKAVASIRTRYIISVVLPSQVLAMHAVQVH